MNIADIKSVGESLVGRIASAFTAVTSGGSGDGVAVTGLTIDRLNQFNGALMNSMLFQLLWEATLGATFNLNFTALKVEDSADGTTWATFTDVTIANFTADTATGLSRGVSQFNVDVTNARRYVRFDWTPNLSRGATDTANIVAAVAAGGFNYLPAH